MELNQALLAGRRGRQLLSGIALSGTSPEAQHLMRSVFEASYDLAQRRGDAVARLVFVAEGDGGAAAIDPVASVDEIAQMIHSLPLLELTPGLLREALADSVANAMYWQPPDGEDTLLADPRIVAALARIARHVAATGIIQGWMAGSTHANQWMITWMGEGTEGQWMPGREPARSQLRAWHLAAAEDERARSRNLGKKMRKVASGNWWSIPPGGLYRSFGTFDGGAPIGLFCVEDGMGWRQAEVQRLQIERRKPEFHISETGHWADLCRRYPLEISATMRRDWFETTGRDGLWVQPDWQAVAEDYDGVHLGIDAYLAGAGEIIEVDAQYASVIAGWNPDETYWFTDAVQRAGEVRTWNIGENDDRFDWAQG